MSTSHVEKRAYELFQGGLHCAEAACTAILESEEGWNQQPEAAKAASACGAGVGRSKAEICGALSGSLIALGILRGRSGPSEPWDDVAALAHAFRENFQLHNDCTRCGELLERFGPQENMEQCKRMTARTAGMMRDLLDRRVQELPARSCGCCTR